jgi:small-conductance mechanosensitive channel
VPYLEGSVPFVATALTVSAILLAVYGGYRVVIDWADSGVTRRRRQTFVSLVRLVAVVVALLSVLAALTDRWLGVLVSFGIIGVAVTFALQQPLFSMIAWVYITVKEPYTVGDRVAIDGTKGDVVAVDFFVTKLWEINGELVSTHQPSGRMITVPNSAVLSSHVFNFTWEEFPYVWNELEVQVSYETDLGYATETMQRVADDALGDEMESRIEEYRLIVSETPVELEVRERPSVNVRVRESWVELRLRYLVHPRQGQRVRNSLYDEILAEFNENPDRVSFPVGRSR